jgi:hypothetical protein
MPNLEIFKDFINKNVFVILKSGIIYNGRLLSVEEDGEIIFIKMHDRFGRPVLFTSGEISKIEVKE